MATYFFDIDDGAGLVVDREGLAFASLKAARDEAARLLPDLAKEAIPLIERGVFRVKIRDSEGRYLCALTLSFAAEWLGDDRRATPEPTASTKQAR
jgi:hypothetical protein